MTLKMVLPKGRINIKVCELLKDIGIQLIGDERNYRPKAIGFDLEVKLLKSQNIPSLVHLEQHDIGFAGLDWIQETQSHVDILEDLTFDPVKIVACIPETQDWEQIKKKPLIVASEYEQLSRRFLEKNDIQYQLIRSYGATEVFPPEDADMVIDNTSTGNTIRANRLKVISTLMKSSTHFIANKMSMDDPIKSQQIQNVLTLIQSVLNGRQRSLLEMNCTNDTLDKLVQLLPSMNSPTISKLYNENGFAVKAAVRKKDIHALLPQLIQAGATDILETPIRKIL